MIWASESLRTSSVTGRSLAAKINARVVPQVVAPTMATLEFTA